MCQLLSKCFSAPNPLFCILLWFANSGILHISFFPAGFMQGFANREYQTETVRVEKGSWELHLPCTSCEFLVGILIKWAVAQQCFFISRAAVHVYNCCWIKSSVFQCAQSQRYKHWLLSFRGVSVSSGLGEGVSSELADNNTNQGITCASEVWIITTTILPFILLTLE